MSNWWESYPVVSADEVESVATATKPAKSDKAAKPEDAKAQEGNWWEAYPAMRADAGPKAILSGIADEKKRQEDAALLHEAHQSIERWGEVPTIASQVITDTAAVGERLIGMNERADEVNRKSAILDRALKERDEARWRSQEDPATMSTSEQAGQYIPFLKQGARGATRSLASALIGSKGAGAAMGAGKVAAGAATGAARGAAARGAAGAVAGSTQGAGSAARAAIGTTGGSAYGAIGMASAQEANKAITEGVDAGLEGSALAGYVASQAIIEAAPAIVMERIGLGGVEAMVAGPAIRGGVKAGFIQAIKATGQEIPEELTTEALHAVATEYGGLDRQALDSDRLSSMVADTILQTVLMGAGAGAMQTVRGAAQERLARLQSIKAKGFVSAEDAASEGLEGKNRRERMASADKEIERLQSEGQVQFLDERPNLGQTTEQQDRPNLGRTPPMPPVADSIKTAQDRFRAKTTERREQELWSDPQNPLRFAIADPEAAKELASKPTYLSEDFEKAIGVATPDPKLRRQWKTWLREAISLEPDVVEALQQEPSDALSYKWTRVVDGVNPPKSDSVEVKQTSFGTLVRLKPRASTDPATQPAASQPGATQPEGQSQDPAAKPESKTFQTSSGSTYELHSDGTTTRNRAERGDGLSTGPQPRSAKTWFADDSELNQLYEQWNNPADVTLREITDANGEKRLATYNHKTGQYGNSIKFSTEPKPGLIPVEYWNDETTIHYGNKIVDQPATLPSKVLDVLRENGQSPEEVKVLSQDEAKEYYKRYGPPSTIDVGEGSFGNRGGRLFYDDETGKAVGYAAPPPRGTEKPGNPSSLYKGTPSTTGSSGEKGTKPTGSPTASPDAPATTPETSMGETGGKNQPPEARAGEPRRGKVGDMLSAGEVVTTSSGRQTTPFPNIDTSSDRKAQNTVKRVDKWLHENAVEEARSRGDDFNLTQFQSEDPANLPPASKDSMEEYLFGEQPTVRKPITKPLAPPADAADSKGTAAPPTIETVDRKPKFKPGSVAARAFEAATDDPGDGVQFIPDGKEVEALINDDGKPTKVFVYGYDQERGTFMARYPKGGHIHGIQPDSLSEPESKWQAETRDKLAAVPAFKGAKFEFDEKAGTVKVTRSDGLETTVIFDADERLARAAQKIGRKKLYGLYFRKNGKIESRIYISSEANHSNILNHEVMHWLEDNGVVTKEEVEQHGGQEAIAEKYGKWASLKQRKKDSVLQRIHDALEAIFSSQARFFEEVGKRQATKPRELDLSISGQSKPIPGMEDEDATYVVHNRKPDAIPHTFSVVISGKPRGKGWTSVKGTGMTAQEAYGRALTTFEGKRAEDKPNTKFPFADQPKVLQVLKNAVRFHPDNFRTPDELQHLVTFGKHSSFGSYMEVSLANLSKFPAAKASYDRYMAAKDDELTDEEKNGPPNPMESEAVENARNARWGDDLENRSSIIFPQPKETVDPAPTATISQSDADAKVEEWKARAKEIGKTEDNSNKVVFSLFDYTGVWSQPWRDAGYTVIQYDKRLGDDLMAFFPVDDIAAAHEEGMEVVGVLSATPCTTMTSAGAKWWATRHDVPNEPDLVRMFGEKALQDHDTPHEYNKDLVALTELFIDLAAPQWYAIENPTGRIGDYLGEEGTRINPTMRFDPHYYGDPYTKKTGLWGDFNTDLPQANVEPTEGSKIHKKSSSDPTRSDTPEGFAYAFFMANHPGAMKEKDQLASLDEDQLPPSAIQYMQQGDRLKGEMWRSPSADGELSRYGAFYAPTEEGASSYLRGQGINVIVSDMIELNNPLVTYTKRDALEELGIEESDLEQPNDEQDPHHYIDIAIFEAATEEGYDGVVYKEEGFAGHPVEVHVFNPPPVGDLPSFTVQGKGKSKGKKVSVGEIIESDGKTGIVTRVKDGGVLSVDFEETSASGRKVSPRYSGFGIVRPGEYTVVGPSPFPATLETFYKQFGDKSPEQVASEALKLWNSLSDDDKSRFAHRLRRFGIPGAKKNSTPETIAESIANVISKSAGVPGKLREIYDIAMEYPQLNDIFNDPKQMELSDEMMRRIDAVGLSLPPMVRAVLPALPDMRMEVLHELAKQQFGKEIADALFMDEDASTEDDGMENLPQSIPAYVISGMQRDPAKIDRQKFTGRPIGVAVGPQRMSDTVIRKIASHVDRGGTLFVDSGMFGTVKGGKVGEEPNWANVFEEYGRVLDAIQPANRRNVMLVAPDYLIKIETAEGKELIIGDPFRTLELQRQHRLSIEELLDQGARVIIPLQRDMSEDPMSLGETASLASDNIDLTSSNFAWGIPYNEAAWPDEDILGFVRDLNGSGMHIHLLGGGKARAEKLWEEIKAIDPTVKLTGDSATEARNAYRADRAAQKEAEAEPGGNLSIDEFADIFANPEAKPKKTTEPKKPKKQPASGKRTGRKDPKEGIKEGLDEAKAGADLIRKALKDLGTNFFSGPPINEELARGMGMLARGLIKAGRYKFAEFIESAVEMLGAPAVRYLGPHLEAGWNKIAETDDRLDTATSVTDILIGKQGEPAVTSAQTRIAERVREALENGEKLDAQKFFAIADEEFGGTRANNDYGDSQATDALELGVNLYLQGKTKPGSPAYAELVVERIQKIMELVPRHRGRTGNKDLMQQFSTPPAYAYVVNWIANVTEDDVVLEPSAGMGGIAIHAANSGAKVYANELDPSRADGLRQLPLEKVFTEDAEQIGAILKGKIPGLTTIIMNPPFSRAGMRMGDKMVQGTDRKHIDEALTLLPDGGRLVAIVGAGLHGQGQKMTQWLDNLPYQLVANIEVAREVYRGYGTEFPTRVLVIDKVPPTDSTLVRSVADLSELIDAATEVRNERPRIVKQDEDQSDSPEGTDEDGQGAGEGDDARDPTTSGLPGDTSAESGQADDGQRGSDRGDGGGDGNASPGATSSNTGSRRGGGGGGRKAGKSSGSGSRSKSKSGSDAPSGKSKSGSRGGTDRSGGLTKAKAKSQKRPASVKTELGDSTFENYVPSVTVEGAKPHPAPIVESAAMAAVDAPATNYEVDLAPGVFEGYVNEDGIYVGISDIQLEAIAMAGAAHEQKLPSGERRGFLIGDGTGVGKAREALGIIMDDFLKRGTGKRRKAVFITKNDGLVKDAVNEWVGVGGDPAEMQPLSNVSSGVPVEYESGVLTLSYDTLKGEASVVAKGNGNTLSRVEQIVDWVGPDFDGVVVFDEAHLMANSLDTGTGNQAKGASMRALAGVDLQDRLPNARFVYLSATAATEVRNLAYAARLGLWGPGTSFATKHAFINEIEAGGVAAMEKVAADMKAMGMYVARNLSFDDGTEKGRVEFDRILHTLTDDQRRVYDKLSEAWLKVLADIDAALDITNNEKGKSRILSAFWSSNQRFWNDVVTTMMAPTLIQGIEKDLKAGRSVVIQLSTTKEAATTRAIAGMKEGQTYDEIDASPRRSLMEYVERAFPTQRHETYIDDAGNERSRPVVDSEGNPVHDPAAVAMKERLLDEIGSLDVAARGPIDMILDHFGTEMVAEISGRSQRLVKGEDGRLELEKRGKASARADRDAFMDGKKRVLLFSEAGGTGASYHASLSAANQQRRSHYLWQPGWSAPVAVQGLGRAHRSNQASAPILHLLEPNLEGYKRFISTIARRLGQLGALTKGQRTAADAGLFGASDNLESTEANSALFQFMRDAVSGNIEGIDREYLIQRLGLEQLAGEVAPTPEMFTITQFLNRMLNLPLGEQSQVFKEFSVRMDNIVAQAIQDGTLDQGMETIKAEKIVKANETIVNEHATGAKTKLVQLTVTNKVKLRTYEDMLREVAGYTQFGLEGFYKSKTSGKVMAVINQNRTSQDDKGRTLHDAMAVGVDGNTYGHSLEQFEKEQYWEELSRDQAKRLWDEQYAKAPTTRDSTEYLLTGALLPIWNKIPGERSRVVRALTADGEMILGRVVPERMLQRTLDSLGIAGEQRTYTPREAIQAVYRGGTVQLVNGWTIKKRTIDGEDNIEIIGPDYASKDAITNAGGFSRRIDYATRFFIPFNDSEGEVLGEITRISPIASITNPRGGSVAQMATPTRQTRSGGTGAAGAAARVPGEGIAAADIQKTAERLFGVAIRHGGFSQRAAGIYKWLTNRNSPPSPEVVRTAEEHYANLAVLAHEIAHHIDETTKAVNSMPAAVKSEVGRLDYEPLKARAFEGWAEFLRRYMTEQPIDVAGNMVPNPALDAPQTLKWFEEIFLQANPALAKSISEFKQYAQQFANQSVFARIGTMITDRKPQDLRFNERWKQRAKRWTNRLKSNFLDKFHTLEWIQNEAKEKGYKGVGIYDLTMAYFLSASSHATIAFEEGVRSLRTGKQIGKTKLWDLSRHLESDGEYDEAIRYALARHTLFMDDAKPGYNTGVDVEDAQAWIDEAEALGKADRYEEFARELAQFNDDLIMMLVDAGAYSREEAGKIINYYRDATGSPFYFPLHRISELDKSDFAGTSPGFVNLGKPVKGRSRKGSGRQIIDPVDATVTRAIKFYGRAIQARQAHTLAQTLDPLLGGVGGMGGLMDRVPPKRVVHQGTIEEILNTLVDSGTIDADQARAMRVAARILDPSNGLPSQKDLDWFAKKHNIADWTKAWSDMEDAAETEPDALAVISLWRPDYTPNAQKRTVMIYDAAGDKLMYEMDDDLYQVATGMQDVQFNGFMNVLREGSRYFKSGAVGLSTGFGTANLIRDYWEFQGKANHVKGLKTLGKPWEMLGRYVAAKTRQAFPKSTDFAFGKRDADLLVRLYEESGGKVYSVIGHDAEGRSIYRRKKIGKSTMSKLGLSISRPMDTANNLLSNLQELIAISDAPPRMADAEAALADHGFVIRNGSWFDTRSNMPVDSLPESARIAASVAMSEATINFKRIGAAGQYVEAFFPFFNATLQATYRQYQQIKNLKSVGKDTPEGERALRFLVYLSALAATGAFYWLLRHDDDDYRNQDSWLRDGYWTWGINGKTYFRLPKPRDFAVVSNVVENMLDAWAHDDARETSDIFLREVSGRIPSGGGMLRGAVETYVANYDYFRGRELETEWMKDIPKQYRTSSYTSRMSDYLGAKFGKTLNTSPVQFQHLLNSSSGGMYGRFADTFDAFLDGRIGPEHVPFVRGLMLDRRQTRPIGEFYQKKEELKEAAATLKIEGKDSKDVADKLARFEWISEIMTALRKDEGKVGKKRTFANEQYITGLARAALGYKEQKSNPNPLTAENLPGDVQQTINEYRQMAVAAAAERLGPRSIYKSDESYAKQKTQIARAEARLQMLDMSLDEAKQALRDYYIAHHGSLYEVEGGRHVMKESLKLRLRKLEELFRSK